MLRKLWLPLLLATVSLASAQEMRHFTFHYGFTVKDMPVGERVRVWIPAAHSDQFQEVKVVSAGGDLANWAVPGGKIMGIGGAMDLAAGSRHVIAMMQHVTKKGELKLVQKCDYLLTATRVVSLVITELGAFEPTGHAFRVIELAPGVTRDQAEGATGAPLI